MQLLIIILLILDVCHVLHGHDGIPATNTSLLRRVAPSRTVMCHYGAKCGWWGCVLVALCTGGAV